MFVFFIRVNSWVNIDCKYLRLKVMFFCWYGVGWVEFCWYCVWGNKIENEKNWYWWNLDFNN